MASLSISSRSLTVRQDNASKCYTSQLFSPELFFSDGDTHLEIGQHFTVCSISSTAFFLSARLILKNNVR